MMLIFLDRKADTAWVRAQIVFLLSRGHCVSSVWCHGCGSHKRKHITLRRCIAPFDLLPRFAFTNIAVGMRSPYKLKCTMNMVFLLIFIPRCEIVLSVFKKNEYGKTAREWSVFRRFCFNCQHGDLYKCLLSHTIETAHQV